MSIYIIVVVVNYKIKINRIMKGVVINWLVFKRLINGLKLKVFIYVRKF